MKPTKLILASVFITAIILVMVGGATSVVMANNKASADAQAKAKAADQAANTDTIKAYQQREEQYNQIIQQANEQLAKANAQLQALQGGQAAAGQPGPANVSAPANAQQPALNVAVSADQAAQIAAKVADVGQTVQKTPDLVNFQGKTAYEVVFQNGSIFVDAQTGEVLFNGTVPQQIDQNQAAKVAADYLKETDILQVDQIQFRGKPLFRVIFKSGTMVYMDTTGQITYILHPGVVQVQSSSGGGGGGGGGSSSHEHEGDHGGND